MIRLQDVLAEWIVTTPLYPRYQVAKAYIPEDEWHIWDHGNYVQMEDGHMACVPRAIIRIGLDKITKGVYDLQEVHATDPKFFDKVAALLEDE